MDIHRAVCPEEWVVARKALVDELTRLRDRLYADPCELPWVRGERTLAFGAANDMVPFAGLFAGLERASDSWTGLFDKLERYLQAINGRATVKVGPACMQQPAVAEEDSQGHPD
jgi:hypothetical protein